MAIRGGEWSTSSRYGSTYYGWHKRSIPLVITIVDAELKKRSVHPGPLEKPVFRVEIEDTTTNEIIPLPRVKEINITRNVEAASDQINLSITDCRGLTPRLPGPFGGRLHSDVRTRVRVHGGYNISGQDRTIRLFSGVLLDRQEEWWGQGSSMTLVGLSLTYVLTTIPGVLQDYHGSLSGAVITLLEGLNIPCTVMAFDDVLIPTEAPISIVEDSLESALEVLFAGQPTLTWYVDTYGCLIVREQKTPATEVSFDYETGKEGNLYRLKPGSSARSVVSQVAVTGKDAASSQLVVSASFLARFGARRSSISSNAITTAAQAQAAGLAEIARLSRALKHCGANVPFNPLMEPMMKVSLLDEIWGTGIDALLDVLRFSHKLTPKGGSTTVDGETDQEM